MRPLKLTAKTCPFLSGAGQTAKHAKHAKETGAPWLSRTSRISRFHRSKASPPAPIGTAGGCARSSSQRRPVPFFPEPGKPRNTRKKPARRGFRVFRVFRGSTEARHLHRRLLGLQEDAPAQVGAEEIARSEVALLIFSDVSLRQMARAYPASGADAEPANLGIPVRIRAAPTSLRLLRWFTSLSLCRHEPRPRNQ
jgi:hypothetical protein